jgi:hypothetical protein
VSDPSATVTVNGVIPSISGNTFQVNLNLAEGANSITASAEDRYGQKASDHVDVTLITKGSIAGIVKDSLTKLPLVSATVTVTDSLNQSYSVLTGPDGKYQITNIASGAFSGDVRKEGYQAFNFSGTMTPGQTIPIDVSLNPILPLISGISVSEVTMDSAMIDWSTDMPAESLVDYGLTSSYGSSAADSALKTAHKITLRNLTPDTTYHFRVTSRNAYGFASSSDDRTLKTLPPSNPITLTITSPKDGDTITRSDVRVDGTVSNALGLETGVTVNGILAQVYGNQFSANHVPLAEGSNPITAKATDTKGNTQTATVGVNFLKVEHYIKATANLESGIAPLEVILTLDSDLDLANGSLTHTGPGEVELLSREGKEYRFRIITEGVYIFAAQVSDAGGTLYEDTVAIAVISKGEMENRLASKWEGMKASLMGGDMEKALGYFAGESQEGYRRVFMGLSEQKISSIFSNITQVKLYSLSDRFAKGGILRQESGGVYSYPVTFILDENGIWKIMGF